MPDAWLHWQTTSLLRNLVEFWQYPTARVVLPNQFFLHSSLGRTSLIEVHAHQKLTPKTFLLAHSLSSQSLSTRDPSSPWNRRSVLPQILLPPWSEWVLGVTWLSILPLPFLARTHERLDVFLRFRVASTYNSLNLVSSLSQRAQYILVGISYSLLTSNFLCLTTLCHQFENEVTYAFKICNLSLPSLNSLSLTGVC